MYSWLFIFRELLVARSPSSTRRVRTPLASAPRRIDQTRDPLILQQQFSKKKKRAGFPRLSPLVCDARRLPPRVSCSAHIRSSTSSPPNHLFLFSARGGCYGGLFLFLCLASCSRRTQPETWGLCTTCALRLRCVFVCFRALTMSLRRSSRISDASLILIITHSELIQRLIFFF